MREHKPIEAEIVETPSAENGRCWKVETPAGDVHFLRGLGAPMGGRLGQKGTIQYTVGSSYGLYFWMPEGAPDAMVLAALQRMGKE